MYANLAISKFLFLAACSTVWASEQQAVDIISKAISALGGKDALNSLKGLASHAYLFRSSTLQESFTPGFPDNRIALAGSVTLSYDLSGDLDQIVQRIDRSYTIGEFWYFGRPQLDPVNASIVTRSGSNGFSCYVVGNEGIYTPTQYPTGYVDAALADVFLRDAVRLYPKLLLLMQGDPGLTASTLVSHGVEYPAVTAFNITVAVDSKTSLPHIIRAYEDHHIFGHSNSDYIVYNYTSVGGLQIPQRIKLMYNEDNLMIDALFGEINVNPQFASRYFDGLPTDQVKDTALQMPPMPAAASAEYGIAEVWEESQNLLWYGGYLGNLKNVTVTYPVKDMPQLIHLVFNDSPGYTTLIANLEDAVMVVDAPPHQSKLVIQWIKDNLNKSPTHLLVTHHHHDHNYGAADYVEAGAALVVPEDYKYYWQAIPDVRFQTSTADKPFTHGDSKTQVTALFPGLKNTHAADWMVFTFTPARPNSNSTFVVSLADAWSPGAVGFEFDQLLAVQYLDIARGRKIPYDSLVIPVHGVPSPSTDLYALTGYDYPSFGYKDFAATNGENQY